MVSLPLNRAWRFRGDVVDDAVDAAYLVDDAVGDGAEEGHVEGVEIGRHAVGRGHGAERADKVIGAVIAHHADRAHR